MSHQKLLYKILFKLGSRHDTRLWVNTVGLARFIGSDHITKVGLCPGSSDLIGFHSKIIKQEDVGKKVAVFLAIEIKAGKDKPNKKQPAWLTMVESMGGIVKIAYNENITL